MVIRLLAGACHYTSFEMNVVIGSAQRTLGRRSRRRMAPRFRSRLPKIKQIEMLIFYFDMNLQCLKGAP
jgi:hypothetical protein